MLPWLFYFALIVGSVVSVSGMPPTNSGEILARQWCGTCHQVPRPQELDKASWNIVLPRMAAFLGLYATKKDRALLMESGAAQRYLQEHDIYPVKPRVDSATWRSIVAYYLLEAPDSLPRRVDPPLSATKCFKPIRPAFTLSPPSTTFLRFDVTNDRLYVADAMSGALYTLDARLAPIDTLVTSESVTWMTSTSQGHLVTVMGSFSPTDAPSGAIKQIGNSATPNVLSVIPLLQRPVHHATADLDGDRVDDLITCEFAKWTGSLCWWKNKGKHYERRILADRTGAIKVYDRDWDRDGDVDLVAMFAQGNEGIWVYLNDGRGRFTEQALMHFPPTWGSSTFSLVDLDGDGDEDIVHCAGDNADFGPVLKPYHGVRLYFNAGDQTFSDPIFLPLHGAYGAIPADFDLDGDVDVAAISFFPDYAGRPLEGFVFFENTGSWVFTQSTIAESMYGRWIVMDAGDIDHDGDLDLALGSLTFEVPGRKDLVDAWIQQAIPFILLENLTR